MNLQDLDRLTPFVAGLAVGVTATLPFVSRSRRQYSKPFGTPPAESARAESACARARPPASRVPSEKMTAGIENGGRRKSMSDLKGKAKQKIDDAAEGAKKTADKVVDRSKDVAHSAGKKMEEGGKQLQDA